MLNLIVAPKKLDNNAERYAKKIVKYLKTENVEYSVYFSQSLDDITNGIAELTLLGESEFVVIGGDEILHHFINSVKDLNKIKIGIVPTGLNDDFAKYIGLPNSPIMAIKQILNKNIEQIDVMLVNDLKVLNNLIIGASVEIYEHFNQFGLKNFITETVSKVKIQNEFKGIELTMASKNNKSKSENIYELVVANGGLNKGKKVSPLSNVSDGLFNLIYSKHESKKINNQTLKDYKQGDHIYTDKHTQLWLDNLKITNSENKIKALVDGKIVNFDKIEVQIIEKGLRLYK